MRGVEEVSEESAVEERSGDGTEDGMSSEETAKREADKEGSRRDTQSRER